MIIDLIKIGNIKTLKDLIQKAVGKFDQVTGIDQIGDFEGSMSSATGAPSDFRHQAASNLVAKALGKDKLGPIGYLSGSIGSFGLGTIKEIGDFAEGVINPNMTFKDALTQAYEDTISNFKGAFAPPDTTTEELYEKIMGDYQIENPFGILRADRAKMIQEAQQRAIDAMLKNRRDENKKIKTTKPGTSGGFIPTKKTKKTTPVTGTTKPGTGGGGGGFTPTTTAQNVARTSSRVEDGRVKAYGLAKGGLAAMLGE